MIVANIQRLCKSKDMTLADLSRAVNIGNGVIARWDDSSPQVKNLAKVADFFGVTVDELIRETGTPAG